MITRRTPEWIEKSLSKYGRTYYGGPIFRMMWSEDLTLFGLGGRIPKYPQKHCWVLEKWCPPSYYGSQQSWEAVRDWEPGSPTFGASVLGPYPHRGDYEPVYQFEELPSSSAVPRVVMELVARLIEAGKAHTRSTRRAAIRTAMEKSEKDWQKFFDDYCADKLSAISCRSGLRFGPWSHRGTQRGPDNIRFSKSTRDLGLPTFTPQKGFVQCPPEMKERLLNLSAGETIQ